MRSAVAGTDSTAWTEALADAGEPEQFSGFAREINRYQAGFARRGDGAAHRGFHVKIHAGVSAQFTVLAEIPSNAKYGVFKEPRTFSAWLRISNGASAAQPDWLPDLVGFAVKLTGIAGDRLLPEEANATTQDFLALNQPFVPADDAQQLMIISLSSANLLTAPVVMIRRLGLGRGVRVMLWTVRWALRRLGLRSVATQDYWSDVPITLGPHAVKFKWQSRPTPATGSVRWLDRNRLRRELAQRLQADDVVFDFLVQFYADPRTTPIEGAFEWKATDAPFVKLAELTIRRRDLDTLEAHSEEQYVNSVSFNPWHGVTEHRPIGNIQRARSAIYRAGALYRGRVSEPRDGVRTS